MPRPDTRNTARILGYSLVLGTLLLLIFLAAFFLREALHTGRTIRVHFPQIAALSEGDPVVEAGVTVGVVDRIALEKDKSVAELRLFHHRVLPEDTRFVNFSHSLMGARKVWILPGGSPLPLDESRLQEGTFAPGIPETLHKVASAAELIRRLQREMDGLQDAGDSLSGPLAVNRRLDEALQALAALSSSLEGAGAALQSGLTAAASAGDRVSSGLAAAGSALDSAAEASERMMDRVQEAATRVAAGFTVAESLLATASDSSRAGRLLASRALYEDLLTTLELLDKTTRLLRRDGLGHGRKIKPRLRSKEP